MVAVSLKNPSCPGPATQVSIIGFDFVRRAVVHRSAPEITEAEIEIFERYFGDVLDEFFAVIDPTDRSKP